MADLASSAVSALLGVIRNEITHLKDFEGDVQFIQEEMESMNSFLLHLARTAPRDEQQQPQHDEQVGTWMNQVRVLAQDCNNFIDLYLYRKNPDILVPAGSRWRRCLLHVPWLGPNLVARHIAADRLRELKERARQVGERRLRYAVEIPRTAAGAREAKASAAEAGDEQEDDEDEGKHVEVEDVVRRSVGTLDVEDYFAAKLANWVKDNATGRPAEGSIPPSIAIVAPLDKAKDHVLLAAAKSTHRFRTVTVDIPGLHYPSEPLPPQDILCYMWRELDLESQATSHQQQDRGDIFHWPRGRNLRWHIYWDKRRALAHINGHIQQAMKVGDKFQEMESKVKEVTADELETDLGKTNDQDQEKPRFSKKPLHVLLVQLHKSAPAVAAEQYQARHRKTAPTLISWYNYLIAVTARRLQECIEDKKQDKKADAQKQAQYEAIHLPQEKYKEILQKVFLRPQEQQCTTTASTSALGEDQIKAMIREAKQDAKQEAQQEILQEVKKMLEDKSGKKQATGEPAICEGPIPQATETKDKTEKTQGLPAADIAGTTEKIKEIEIFSQGLPAADIAGTTEKIKEIEIFSQGLPAADIAGTTEKIKEIEHEISSQGLPAADIAGTTEKIKEIKHEIEALLRIKGIRDKIRHCLEQDESILIILNISGEGYAQRWDWEETKNALSLLGCVAGAVIVTNSTDTHPAKEYCSPPLEPMEYSLVGLYHDIALELIRKQEKINEEGNMHIESHVIHNILEKCEPHEFSMKIFAHALYANIKMSSVELQKLSKTIERIEKKSLGTVAMKMLKFSYNGLPRDYKTCLLYLAIFSPGNKIRRSTLIGRWVAEGLITTDDWRWQNSVQKAERCFDMLVDRCLVNPADISATGKAKSCTVDDLVHKFITKVAKEHRLIETRLSHHLARHFSISNTLRLRSSHKIDDFLKGLSESSQFFMLKVLDLQDCQCFGESKKDYLKDICRKVLLLKYLSLRGTNVAQLPTEIKDLRELEVLDIRQTSIPAKETREVKLSTKLKRLLAGDTSMSTSRSVEIPKMVNEMEGMEVLTGVKPRKSKDLLGIGHLDQLKKLGVVIEFKEADISHLLQAINDVGECLHSLSITLIIPTTTNKNTPSSGESPKDILKKMGKTLKTKAVRSLSISGTTRKEKDFLVLLASDQPITKVTLRGTSLSQEDLEDISKKLPKLQCVSLRHIICPESKLTFKDGEFQKLKYIRVEDCELTEISFEHGAPQLEKIALCSPKIESVMGINSLQKLEELELNKNRKLLSILDSANQISKVTLLGTMLTKDELQNLAKKQNLRCLVLLEDSCKETGLTFSKDDLPMLNLLIINCPVISEISFDSSSAPKLVKIAWTFTNMKSLSGIDNLLKLRELELNGGVVPDEVKKNIEKIKNKVYYKYNEPAGNQNQANEDPSKEGDDVDEHTFCCIKNKVWR